MSFPSHGSADLYDPAFEHDACGVGFICRLDGEPTHDMVRQGLQILQRLAHRGGSGADPDSGDGAGLLIQVPHAFMTVAAAEANIRLPEAGKYGVGLAFMPKGKAAFGRMTAVVEAAAEAVGATLLGWRAVPTQSGLIGQGAQAKEPQMWHLFVGQGPATAAGEAFERTLFRLRKHIEHAFLDAEPGAYYLCSLSARTLVYKGMLTVDQLPLYFLDLQDTRLASALAMVHSRFSTNTFPRWSLAQPFRRISHNGEINTLRGNINAMQARASAHRRTHPEGELTQLMPWMTAQASDSAVFDNVLELLCFNGYSLPHAVMMMIPEAWEGNRQMPAHKRDFYAYHASLMEAWDGPATVPFTDGRYIGAVLDRNGLRPSRYTVTRDGLLILSSETGVLDIDPAEVVELGRLQPGKMLLADLAQGRIIGDEEIKDQIIRQAPYGDWLNGRLIPLATLPPAAEGAPLEADLQTAQRLFGFTLEDLRLIMAPMVAIGKEPLGSMGDDTPLAVLSDQPRLLYDYFRQRFAQVTNPPLDALREKLVTSLRTTLGPAGDLFNPGPARAPMVALDHPVLTNDNLARIRQAGWASAATLTCCMAPGEGGAELAARLETLNQEAELAIEAGHRILILSDRTAGQAYGPIPALLATASVHRHLTQAGLRRDCALVVESGEPREVHHFCTMIGFGADAINPYLALDTVDQMVKEQVLVGGVTRAKGQAHYVEAVAQGILKVMSKMGISTLQSYRGAQLFEALGVAPSVIDAYFTGTPTRLGGIDLDLIAEEARQRHALAYPPAQIKATLGLPEGGRYQWRRRGARHLFNPQTIAHLQQAVQRRDEGSYAAYAALINDATKAQGTLRGLLTFEEASRPPVPLEEVEPWTDIVKRFKTGAMSYGSLSGEAHETLAVAMNQIGGRSNTGEGGEEPRRYAQDHPGRSRIKQVASGRFGVTIAYLASADEIQIKMAQGAKPGEGGQLPGRKVYPWIARTRHSTPYVGLISPPPHHDIYSIEDLAQLIYDLKRANPRARVSVKLVSEVGVGTVAAGVAKGKADVVLISGHDGGTGASPRTSIAHAGLPWELGLSETHQTLVRNGLRERIRIECDGQLKTGRDVAVAALMGADEFGFATAPLVAMGCLMMRKCHLNTCPVGIATQDPDLRTKFTGQPEHVINYFYLVAEELRAVMARLGYRTLDEMVGQVQRLRQRDHVDHWKAHSVDLSRVLARAVPSLEVPVLPTADAPPVTEEALIQAAAPALEAGTPVWLAAEVRNTDRALGTRLSYEMVRSRAGQTPPEGLVTLALQGAAGQSFCAFGTSGLRVVLEGEANDYVAKGLSGAEVIIKPPATARYVPHEQILIGNVALFGATSGRLFVRGQAGERFAVRNSGAEAVVEGVGDHGCEYMTGGRVVVLGPTGRNFAAGMSGGIAYVLDGTHDFRQGRCNTDMVDLEPVVETDDVVALRALIEAHHAHTGSDVAAWVLDHWAYALGEFVKVMPIEYRQALQRLQQQADHVAA